ncbi:CPBP family intramembrane glutamic endopeptidase [Jeotgalibacillus marinus]|uniref:CPBP family intramembrane glutamic endopeptidase n=1 Tax=Jeotgalibacillus marinus TaxID=86667 RepID=A0ABV3Q8D6_9BACL
MNKQVWWLIGSLLIIHLLIYITFFDNNIFWYLYSGTALVMIAVSIIQTGFDERLKTKPFIFLGLISGVVLYVLFFAGYLLFSWLPGNVDGTIAKLFEQLRPDQLWKLVVLIIIVIPAEEIFWRGFVQQRLQQYFSSTVSVAITALLAGSVFYYSGEWIWMLAAFVGSVFWGILYAWKKNILMVILSHLTFSLLFFYVIFI